MYAKSANEILRDLRSALARSVSMQEILEAAAVHVGKAFGADFVAIAIQHGAALASHSWSKREGAPLFTPTFDFDGKEISFDKTPVSLPLFVHDSSRVRLNPPLLSELQSQSVRSYAAVPIFVGQDLKGWIECAFVNIYFRWRKEDMLLVQHLSDYVGMFLEQRDQKRTTGTPAPSADVFFREQLDEERMLSRRIVEYGNIIILRTDETFRITYAMGDTERTLGLTTKELLEEGDVWGRIIHADDAHRLNRAIRKSTALSGELSEEVRVVHQKSNEIRWLLIRGKPVKAADGALRGWEGFGMDVTDKRRTQEELVSQSKRVQALYEVSRALQVTLDPALVTLKGLRALINATGSDCGYGVFYSQDSGKMEVVSAEGLSRSYLENLNKLLPGKTLLRHVIESKQGILIGNIQKDPRAAVDLARMEGLRSAIMIPLVFEDEVLGALILFCRKANRYSDLDYELVQAAAGQIALSIRQAEYYTAEKQEANSIAVLYRLSHQLSRLLTPKEVAEHAFPIIQEELACKRMWLGVINEAGTHIVGQGGVGPGIRQKIIEMQIELELRHDFLDEAIKTRQAVIVKPGDEMECSGFNRVIQKLNPGTFVICPLVSLGQVVGVFIVEPAVPSIFFAQKKLPLLMQMANEMAAVILARRFESKMADADKMRMAGLLASGVAHNFNNLLQAVMGQASLIEMQVAADSPLGNSARTIVDAAGKGASLIRQLLSFTMHGAMPKKTLSINQMLMESKELYESVLGSAINLELRLDDDTPEVYADYGQLQQIVTNLLMNAKEAIGKKDNGFVRISTSHVRLRSGEVDPELSPGPYIRVDVRDNGVGMDAERLARCFEPFFTTKNVDSRTGLGFQGSGLGLSSAYSIAKRHDGIITARSNPGDGAVFSIYFPAAHVKSTVEAVLKSSPSHLQPAGIKAVLVDLEETMSASVRSTLETLNLPTRIAIGREQALETVKRDPKSVKLFLVDVDRAQYDVVQFFRAVREVNADMRIVVASSENKRWSGLLGDVKGVQFVGKPLSAWAVHAIVRNYVGSTGSLTPEKVVTAEKGEKPLTSGVESDDDDPLWEAD